MRVEVQIYEKDANERKHLIDGYDIALSTWLDKEEFARGEKPQAPQFATKFAVGKIKTDCLLSYYIVDEELIRVETEYTIYNIKNTSEVKHKLNELIPD